NGDTAKDPSSLLGLKARISGSQLIAAGVNGGPLVLDDVVKMQDAVVGADNSQKPITCNKAYRRTLSSKVRADAKGMGVFDASGTQIQSFNGSPIDVIDEDGDEQPIISNTETYGNSSANLTSAYCTRYGSDTDEEYIQGLAGSKMIEHVEIGLLGTFYLDL